MIEKVIGVTHLQRHLRAVLDDVVRNHVPYVLARGRQPEAVLISFEEFQRYRRLQEQDVLDRFDRLAARMAERNAGFDDEEVAADVAAARAERAR